MLLICGIFRAIYREVVLRVSLRKGPPYDRQCLACGAQPGEHCRDSSGRVMKSHFHMERYPDPFISAGQRNTMRLVPCPDCGAGSGQPCIGPAGTEQALWHPGRHAMSESMPMVGIKIFFCPVCDEPPGERCTPLPSDAVWQVPGVQLTHGERTLLAIELCREVKVDDDLNVVDEYDPETSDPKRVIGVRERAQKYSCIVCEATPGQYCIPAPHEDDFIPGPIEGLQQPIYLRVIHEQRLNLAVDDMVPVRRRKGT